MSDHTAILRGLTPLYLARAAGCADPASPHSPGAVFLAGIAGEFADYTDEGPGLTGPPAEIIAEALSTMPAHRFWEVFTELAAYRETPDDTGAWPASLESAARMALEQIAARLCRCLAALTTPAAGPLIAEARELLEGGPAAADPEYTRGVTELVTRTLGLTSDDEPIVVAVLFGEATA